MRYLLCVNVWVLTASFDSMIRLDQGPQVFAQAGYSSEDDFLCDKTAECPIPDEGDSRSGNLPSSLLLCAAAAQRARRPSHPDIIYPGMRE